MNARIFKRSGGLNQVEALVQIKSGLRAASNSQADALIIKHLKLLPQDTRNYLENDWAFTSTFLIRNPSGSRIGQRVVFTDNKCTIEAIVPSECWGVFGEFGLAIDLSPKNFSIKIISQGAHVVVEFDHRALTVVETAGPGEWGCISMKSLYLPQKHDGGHSKDVRYSMMAARKEFASLVQRSALLTVDDGRKEAIEAGNYGPSVMRGLLVLDS